MMQNIMIARPGLVTTQNAATSAPLSLEERMKRLSNPQKETQATEEEKAEARADFLKFIMTQINNDFEQRMNELKEPVQW
ncbi:hypothetical protein [Rouxiella badensis]|uniref:hypothetical protein n=1 Tax=Rouxiella badensis TaxID=1646377 RepID=UPI00301E11DB